MEPVFSEHSLMTDNGMLTSLFALEPSLKTHNNSHREGLQRKDMNRVDNTDSEIRGPPSKFNSGPPYLMGEEVLCEVNGMVLRRAFVLKAEHP